MFLAENRENDLNILHLGLNSFNDDCFFDILSTLQWHSNLSELYLGNNDLSNLGVGALLEVIEVW
jgi:hypothetical protein